MSIFTYTYIYIDMYAVPQLNTVITSPHSAAYNQLPLPNITPNTTPFAIPNATPNSTPVATPDADAIALVEFVNARLDFLYRSLL